MATSTLTSIIVMSIAVSGWIVCLYTLYRFLKTRKQEIKIVNEILKDIQDIKTNFIKK